MNYCEIKKKLLAIGICIDNEYLDKYCNLVVNCSKSEPISGKTNYHHIIPRLYYAENNLPLDSSKDNICILLYKDHVLAHFYLAMAAKNNNFKMKMLYSVEFVLCGIKNLQERDLIKKLPEIQQRYEIVSHELSINNPARRPEVAKIIQEKAVGRTHIHDATGKNKTCFADSLDYYLSNGYELGWKTKYKSHNKNKISIVYNDKVKYVTNEELEHYLSLGAKLGAKKHIIKNKGNMGKRSEESNKQLGLLKRGKIAIHEKTTGKIMYIDKKDLDVYLKNNYALGTNVKSFSAKGKIWINNGIKEQYILPEKLDEYLSKGFTKGRLRKTNFKGGGFNGS